MHESKYSPSRYGPIVGQAGLFNLPIAIGLKWKVNTELKPVKSRLKFDPVHDVVLVKIYISYNSDSLLKQ